MNPRTWIEESVVWAVHEAQLATLGGSAGVRDPGLLASELARPFNLANYNSTADVAALAAAYGFGIAHNDPFIDGNRPTAFVCCELFLVLNGYALTAEDSSCVSIMLALAGGDISEADFASWLRTHTIPV